MNIGRFLWREATKVKAEVAEIEGKLGGGFGVTGGKIKSEAQTIRLRLKSGLHS
jgi:hypothetical protein